MTTIVLIPDTSVIISLGVKLRDCGVFGLLRDAGFKIYIQPLLLEREIKKPETRAVVAELFNKNIFELGESNTEEEIDDVSKDYRKMHPGESDVFVACRKLIKKIAKTGEDIKVYCVFDDKGAQKAAEIEGLDQVSSKGLVEWLKETGKISPKMAEEILKKLDKGD